MNPKPLPQYELRYVLHPETDKAYAHFADAAAAPFDGTATSVHRRNAWWLVDAALLSYWSPATVAARFQALQFTVQSIDHGGTQCFVAVSGSAVIVTFRGTQPNQWQDVLDDIKLQLVPWADGPAMVHSGFKDALDRVWPDLAAALGAIPGARVWFSGHSLGAALAILAADRWPQTAGVVTIGCPRVGDEAFAKRFDATLAHRSRRYVNNTDVVTHVPPHVPWLLPYKHVGTRIHIAADGIVSSVQPPLHHYFRELIGDTKHLLELFDGLVAGTLTWAPRNLLDHMPKAYAIHVWNDLVAHGD